MVELTTISSFSPNVKFLVQHAETPLQLKYFMFVFIYLQSTELYKGKKTTQ